MSVDYKGPRLSQIRPDWDDSCALFQEKEYNPTQREAYVSEAREFMRENASNPDLKLSDVARAIHVTERGLQRAFAASGSSGFRAELIEIRMRRAKRLLPSHSIREVAQVCGYRGPMHFSKAFKRSLGMSPRAWKNQASLETKPLA